MSAGWAVLADVYMAVVRDTKKLQEENLMCTLVYK